MTPHVAKPYIAGTPQAEVIGQTMVAFLDNLQADVTRPALVQHGIEMIDPEEWYPHQVWMDVLKTIETNLGGGASMTFVAFGRKVVETAVMPDTMKSIPDALNALHAIHHANLRNVPEEEGYSIEAKSDNHYIVYHNTPNPDDAIYGFLWGMAARFKGDDEVFLVEKIDNPKPEIARSAFLVKWGPDNSYL